MARRNQLLPWAWDHLTPVDLTEIATVIWELPKASSDLEKEAAFAIAGILTTGRRLEYICALKVVASRQEALVDAPYPYLIRQPSPHWLMHAGSPGRQYARRPKKKDDRKRYQDEKTVLLEFPLSKVALHCLNRLLISGNSASTPLFAHDHSSLQSCIERMLRDRRSEARYPRRSSRTLEVLERYLTRAITHEAGGDIGPAARFTDRDEAMSRSVIHYGVSRLDRTVKRAGKASRILNRWMPEKQLSSLQRNIVGSPRSPNWNDIRLLKNGLGDYLRDAQDDVERRHLAMTFYTVALLSFALGHRGRCELLPGSLAVDPVTRFCKIQDKLPSDPTEARLAWVALPAFHQMIAYEDHVARILTEIESEQSRNVILNRMLAGRLPIFRLRNGKVKTLFPGQVWALINHRIQKPHNGFRFHSNSGRHWIRAELEGEVSTETLHAFLGHWQNGLEPWSLGSCLDPLLYRADLEGGLGSKFNRLDWGALNADGRAA